MSILTNSKIKLIIEVRVNHVVETLIQFPKSYSAYVDLLSKHLQQKFLKYENVAGYFEI